MRYLTNNKRSEQNDAERIVIRLIRKDTLGDAQYYSAANQVKRHIKSVVADGDVHLEPYFVY